MSTQNELIEQRRRRIEDRVAHAIANLFVRYPHLTGFYLQDPAGFDTVLNPPAQGALSILDIGFSVRLDIEAEAKVRELIHATVSQIVSDRPEAFDLLRDRTFARVFH